MTQLATPQPNSARAPLAADDTEIASLAALHTQRTRLLERLMPLAQEPATAAPERIAGPLQRFCKELINYLAAGHYYMLHHVRGAWSQRALIAQTTECAMQFAEQHQRLLQEGQPAPSWQVTRSQLDKIALLLTDRFDTEDQLLAQH